MTNQFDYIVVGGGSAGCVIATRLIERTQSRVLLLEAGAKDIDPFIHMPAGIPQAISRHSFGYSSPANPLTGLPEIALPQGKVLGGGSSINAMLYVRGTAKDYDDWEQVHGCVGWGYKDVLPYFIRSECNESLSAPLHGTEGHLFVSESRYRHPLSTAFVRAGQELGYPYMTDICGAQECEAVGFWQYNIRGGKRASTAQTYLRNVLSNERLTLITGAVVEKILIEGGNAVGVRYSVKGKEADVAHADREVIVTAGAIGSPKLLLLSGVGPADQLRALDVEVLVDNPQVGKNLQDHLMVQMTAETPEVESILRHAHGFRKLAAGIEWLAFHDGVVSSNAGEVGAYADTDQDGRIDTQIFCVPMMAAGITAGTQKLVDGITIETAHVYPESRGEVKLTSADPSADPYIQANYLSVAADLDAQIRGMRAGLKFFDTPSLKRITKNVSLSSSASNEEFVAYFKERCNTVFHPTSSCRMGSKPEDSVVDLSLKVWGVERLRVADSSVMPHIVSGNTNAPTVMIAERAADLIA